jgi:hypothetical protein
MEVAPKSLRPTVLPYQYDLFDEYTSLYYLLIHTVVVDKDS